MRLQGNDWWKNADAHLTVGNLIEEYEWMKHTKGEFVIRLHHAERAGDHYDLHLDGETWAIRKGVPKTSGTKVLAIMTAYHSPTERQIKVIEEGYGKGTYEIIDEGEMTIIDQTPNKIAFQLQGNIYRGNYTLVNTPTYGKNAWLLIKQ